MPSYSCSSSRHLPTRLLQLCPTRSAFIHTTTLILNTTHCCSSNKRSVLETTSHLDCNCTGFPSMPVLHSKSPSSCITSILEPLHHKCHPWLRHALLPGPEDSDRGDFAVIRTNLKFGSRAFSVAGPREWNTGTALLFQFANAHLLPNLSQN